MKASHLLASIATASILAVSPAAKADGIGVAFEPPAVSKLKCTDAPVPALDRDWRTWNGSDTDVAPEDLLAVAKAYAEGTASLDPDPATAEKILQHIVAGKTTATGNAREELAKATLKTSKDKAEIDNAVKELEKAVGERDLGAAQALGQIYESGGPAPRDPVKALAYYRMGATAGDPDALLGVARLAKAGSVPDMNPQQADQAVRLAVLALLTDIGQGNCQSLYRMGLLYEVGDIVPKDMTLAAHWYEAAARADHHPKAAERLARLYTAGDGVDMSLPKAFEFLKVAAEGGRSRPMLLLGEAYALGDGTPKDPAAAIRWLEKADAHHEVQAIRWLARAWRGEFGGTPDAAKSFSYLKRDAERPDADKKTFYEIGGNYLNGVGTRPDVNAAIEMLRRAAALGVKDAAQVVGDIYRDGRGVPVDPLRAARFYRQAASLGNVGAMSALSELHKCGLGVPWSLELKQLWSERAAFNGSGSNLYDYALALPAPQSSADAARRFRLLRQAASLDSREAMVLVSIAYQHGTGVAADQRLAAKWRERALEDGDDAYRGYVALAAAYEDGTGVPRDMNKARDLLEQGADSHSPQAEYELARFLAEHGGNAGEARSAMIAAAIAGNATAMRTLSRQLAVGAIEGGKDRQGWLTAAATAGDTRAKVTIARQSSNPGEIEARLDDIVGGGVCESDQMADLSIGYLALQTPGARAKGMVWLERAAKIGSPDHQVTFTLGQALATGAAGADLKARGLTLLEDAADAGLVKAMRQLAIGYQTALFGKPDAILAMQWLERAAAAGDATSAVDYAKFAAGDGHPGDLEKAHGYLAKAAENSPSAARQLGQLSIQGLFGPAAQAEAAEWLSRAAESGDTAAMRDLADLLATGAGGIARDPAKSIDWLRRAASNGDPRAMFKLGAAYEAGFGIASDATQADQWYARARKAGITETQ